MIVHFAASSSKVVKNIANYRAIIKAIHAQGAMLANDWIEPAYMQMKKGKNYSEENWQIISRSLNEALARSELLIADITDPSFGTGFHVATAMHQKMPVLLLEHQPDVAESSFITGIENSLVERHSYTHKNVESIVSEFIRKNTIETKDLRFNFFIDRDIYNYLRWSSIRTGKTKAEILRELVIREIDKT